MALFTPSPFRQMLLLVFAVVVMMYVQNNIDMPTGHGPQSSGFDQYYPIDDMGNSFQDITNESKHLYPYLAAVISVVCLVGTILGIICLAPE